jgi:hypothetical protein
MDSGNGWTRGFDFTPVMVVLVLVFVAVATFDLLRTLPGGERGLLLFERACPIYNHHTAPQPQTRAGIR